MNCRKAVPSTEDLIRAEKQVIAGVYGRLYARFIASYTEKQASQLALAVAGTLLSQPSDDKQIKTFIEQNQELIDQEMAALKDDTEIRRIVTDTLVLKIVFLHRKRGCSSEEALKLVERLKQQGLYQEGTIPPTPGAFVSMASRFFAETPLRPPVPPSMA